MSCRTTCEQNDIITLDNREVTVRGTVSGRGRQAYLLAQQRLLTERLATLSVTRQAHAIQEIQAELGQLANRLALVS